MYRRTLPLMHNREHIEALRKQTYLQMEELFAATLAVQRERDQRKYRGQVNYIFFQCDLKRTHDYHNLKEALYELTKLQRKMIGFWFYPGCPLDYQEAVCLYMKHPLIKPHKYEPLREPPQFK